MKGNHITRGKIWLLSIGAFASLCVIAYMVLGFTVRTQSREIIVRELLDAGAHLEYHNNGLLVIFRGRYDARKISLPCSDRGGDGSDQRRVYVLQGDGSSRPLLISKSEALLHTLIAFDRLEVLELTECEMSEEAAETIMQISGLRMLTLQNVAISPAVLASIKRRLPNCVVSIVE